MLVKVTYVFLFLDLHARVIGCVELCKLCLFVCLFNMVGP